MGANLPQKYTEDISVMTFTEYAEFCPMKTSEDHNIILRSSVWPTVCIVWLYYACTYTAALFPGSLAVLHTLLTTPIHLAIAITHIKNSQSVSKTLLNHDHKHVYNYMVPITSTHTKCITFQIMKVY